MRKGGNRGSRVVIDFDFLNVFVLFICEDCCKKWFFEVAFGWFVVDKDLF